MDPTIYRSLLAIDPNTNYPISTNYILSTDGLGDLQWQSVIDNISSVNPYLGNLSTTIYNLSNQFLTFSNGLIPGTVTIPNLTSTTAGIYNPERYISCGHLTSTATSLLSSIQIFNTISSVYISSSQLQSTVRGLGTLGYISASTLYSTISGLGNLGYASTSYVINIINNLGSSNYISSASLLNSINNLGSLQYVSSASLFSTVITGNNALFSTTADILNKRQNIYLNQAGSLIISGSNVNVTISSISSYYFYKTFYTSSLTYKGINNSVTPFVPSGSYDFYISTLDSQLSNFSSYINPKTSISLDIYPNIIFPQITTNCNSQIYHVSSFLQYNGSSINILHQTKFLSMNNNASNLFQQPIRLNIPGNYLDNGVRTFYTSPYLLTHRFINVFASNTNVGFTSNNVNLYFDSTSSYYLSIQNIAP
uniref:Uncharacterized protein n=1 Tax=viral metagenome TaxID=1070528 RepID=A0A6C0D5F8_9ZZZZ